MRHFLKVAAATLLHVLQPPTYLIGIHTHLLTRSTTLLFKFDKMEVNDFEILMSRFILNMFKSCGGYHFSAGETDYGRQNWASNVHPRT